MTLLSNTIFATPPIYALEKAAERNLILAPTVKYVINRYKPRIFDQSFIDLIRKLIKFRTCYILQYLITHLFGAKSKGDVPIFIADKLLNAFNCVNGDVVQFCIMMEWTKSQFGSDFMASKISIQYYDQIKECFDHLPDC